MKGKRRKVFSKVIAVLMAVAFAFTLVPASPAKAAEGDDETTNSGIVLSKTATLEDDGTYTINLEAYATGTTTTITEKSGVPLDIVLVLDQSGSMANSDYIEPLKTAVTSFVNTISDNGKEYNVDHRIAMVGYASRYDSNDEWANTGLFINGSLYNYQAAGSSTQSTRLTSQNYKDALVSVNDTNGNVTSSITTAISNINGNGATYTNYGMIMANGVFENNPISENSNRKRIVVVFTDGQPGRTSYDETVADAALEEAYKTKNTYGATVYTVGLYSNASNNVTTFMNYLSSNYPTAQSMSGNYEYTPVYNLNTRATYYLENGTSVTYRRALQGWYDNKWNKYTPKTSADDSEPNHVQFCTRTESTPIQEATKYYMTTSDSSELGKIFTNISEDIQQPSTDVTLNEGAIMRDVIADGFILPEDYDASANIEIKTVSGSTTDGSSITWGEETASPSGIMASVEGQNVDITGFNYSDKYIAPGHDGEKLVVTIKGVEATDAAITNNQVDTNVETSGIYQNSSASDPIDTFPQPKTILTSKAYVLDYAKKVTLNASDWKQNGIEKITSSMEKEAEDFSATYGNITQAEDNSSIAYQPKTTKWDGYDSFYVFGTTSDDTIKAASANTNGNLWSKVSVIPANNVYYEDDFETSDDGTTIGIVYTGSWTTDSTSAANTETANNDVHGGWIENDTGLSDDTKYSDGSAHVADVEGTDEDGKAKTATATFTFKGTGVDIYSRTNMTTGTVLATLVGNTADGTRVAKACAIDNKAKDGDYYQIPTASFGGLEYGTYTVTIQVTTAASSEGRYTYYLDGIRVYNPIQEDDTVKAAYGESEINAEFTEVRDILESGAYFIDEDENGDPALVTYDESQVSQLAPKHEVYLAKGQSIVIGVTGDENNAYYIGLKAPKDSTSVAFSSDEEAATTDIEHASDLYYKVSPSTDLEGNKIIVVKNTGDNLLSITKLRIAGSGESSIMSLSDEVSINAITTFKAARMVEYSATAATDEELTEQETPETSEPTEPEVTEPEEPGDVVIDNPEPEEKPADKPVINTPSWINKIFNAIRGWFGR